MANCRADCMMWNEYFDGIYRYKDINKKTGKKEKLMEITEKMIDETAARCVKSGLDTFYGENDVPFIEKQTRAYVKEVTGVKLKKMHSVRGMRELRAIGLDYSIFDTSFALRAHKDFMAFEELFSSDPKLDQAKQELNKTVGLTQCFIAFFNNHDFAIMDPPIEHHIINDYPGTRDMMLHNENGPAILYADGSCMYALWDIKVDARWVTTPADQLDPTEVLSIENVDERAVVLRRMGLHRATDGAGIMDAVKASDNPQGPYKLMDLGHLFEGNKAVFLQMTCPSTGKVHVEGVDNECSTVQEALNWRSGTRTGNWKPAILDGVHNNGGLLDQRQQGDLHMEFLLKLPEGGTLRADRQLQDENTVIRHTIATGDVYDFEGYQCIVTDSEGCITHPEHNTVHTFNGVTRVWNGREVDHVNNIVRDLLD